MGKLYQISSEIMLVDAFGKLGIPIGDVFPNGLSVNKYISHRRWIISENSNYFVVNSLPLGDFSRNSYWEEWYSLDDSPPIHHVLFLDNALVYDEKYIPPREYDGIHPNEIFGQSWYMRDMDSMLLWELVNQR
jgi:hypothetical protein